MAGNGFMKQRKQMQEKCCTRQKDKPRRTSQGDVLE